MARKSRAFTLLCALVVLGQTAGHASSGPLDAKLIRGIKDQDKKLVASLLNAGANPNATDAHGNPALIVAVSDCIADNAHDLIKDDKAVDIARDLIKHGANVNCTDTTKERETPLHIAATANSSACVKLLVDHHANVNATTASGLTPLMRACSYPFAPVPASAVYLVQHGADVNARSVDGEMALTDACVWHHVKLMRFLLAHGAKANTPPDSHGATALSLAKKDGATEIIALLVKYGAHD